MRSFPWLLAFALLCAGLGVASRVYGWNMSGWITAAWAILPIMAGVVWSFLRKSD